MVSKSDFKRGYREDSIELKFEEKSCSPTVWRYAVVIVICVAAGVGIGYYVARALQTDRTEHSPYKHPQVLHGNLSQPSLFSPLSEDEINSVVDYCRRTNITSSDRSVPLFNRNKIVSLSLLLPSKDAALSYLDSGGPFPARFARVYVDRAQENSPYFAEYQIGPLRSARMTHKVLRVIADYDRRPRTSSEAFQIEALAEKELEKLNDLLQECFGGIVGKGRRGEMRFRVSVSALSSEHGRLSSLFLLIPGKLSSSDILPVFATISHGGLDKSKWKVFDIYFFRQGPFANAEKLIAAYKSGTLELFKFPKGYVDQIRPSRNYERHTNQPLRKHASKRPPKTVEPEGPRYTLTGNLVDWMGWSLELSVNNYHGPAIFNIRYKGERIIYENSLSDLTLLYSSLNTGAGMPLTILSDEIFRMAAFSNVIQGLDCPEYATILNIATFSERQQAAFFRQGVCIFEADGQRPLWRHSGKVRSGMNNNYLNIRFPFSLGNYDYVFDFQFYLDGKIGTYATASGCLYTSFWFKDDETVGPEKSRTQFGFRVAEHSVGSIHDHLFAFKVDVDVVSRNNTFEKIHWRGGEVSEAIKSQTNRTLNISGIQFKSIRYLGYEKLKKENGIKIDSKPIVWTVINENLRNKWGNFRGIKIEHTQEYQEVLSNDHPALSAVPQMKYNIAVTKHRDNEEFVDSFQYDDRRLHDPIHNLDHFLNDEGIENEDIVTWMSVHFLHLPSNEDFPMTTGAPKGFLIKPLNFFDETPTFDMPQFDVYSNGTILNNPYSVNLNPYSSAEEIDRPDYV